MYDKAIKDMEAGTGIYDMVYIEQDIIYAYLNRNFLTNITQSLKDMPELKAPTYDDANFTSFSNYFKDAKGDLFGIPMEAFLKLYLYRKDLFEDPKIKEAYKAKTARTLLRRPRTKTTQPLPTSSPSMARPMVWNYGAQPHRPTPVIPLPGTSSSNLLPPTFGVYNWGIDANNNYAASVANGGSMNSDKAKAALKWWLHLRDIGPPESAQSTWTEVGTTFAAGRAAQGLVYGENGAWIQADETKSKVTGKVGFALPPLAPGVLDEASAGKGYIGYYDGGAFGLPVTSKNKEAALLFLQYIGQNEVQPGWAVAAPRITNTATYDDPAVKEMDAKLGGYYTMLRDQGKLFAGALPIRSMHSCVAKLKSSSMRS